MCQTNPKTLFHGGHYNITTCLGCRTVGLFYNNILSSFEHDQFVQFADSVSSLKFQDVCVPFPDGQARVILKTCHRDIQFCFNYPEFVEFQVGLSESLVLLEIQDVLNQKTT